MPPYVDYQKPGRGSTPAAQIRPVLPRSRRWRAPGTPSLAHFVAWSMLLHALFILLFGAPAGGSRQGRAMWGSLDVTIASPSLPVPSLRLDTGGLSADRPLRSGYRSPETRRPAPEAPVGLTPSKEIRPPRIAPGPARERPAADPVRSPEPRIEPLPVQPLFPPSPRGKAPEPPPLIPPSAPSAETLVVPQTTPVPPAEPEPAPLRAEPPAASIPVVPLPLVQPAPPPVETRPTPPVERAPVEAPVVPVPPPVPERRITSPVERAPVEAPAVPAEPVLPPLERSAPRRPDPVVTPPEPAVPSERADPRPVERPLPSRTDPATRGPSIAPPVRDTDLFGPRSDEPAAKPDARTRPTLDLDVARRRARELQREGTGNRALLPFPMPPVAAPKSKEELAIERARKPDCKTAYKDLGLLAVIPLVANEFGEGNCRW